MESTRKTLIVGAGGQVGAQITAQLGLTLSLQTARRAPSADWLSLDLAKLQSVSDLERNFAGIELGAIYCVGGMTNVELCESNADLAMRTNCIGPSVLAKFSHQRSIPFVYFSTEYVFDGAGGPYDEESVAAPISVYGDTKWKGEVAVLSVCPQALVVRTTVVYGPDAGCKNFLYAMRRTIASGGTFRVPEDQVSTPTYNYDLARVTIELVKRGASGIFHVCGHERMSRLDLALRAATFWGLGTERIYGVRTLDLGQKARRPLDAGLSIQKLRNTHPDLQMLTLDASLRDWLKREPVVAA